MRLSVLLLLFFGGVLRLGAQDTHFTLHDYQPLWLNPAHTGAYSGSVRIGGIYRGQWYTLNGIKTPSAYADAPIVRGLRKQDWIGVGALLINDSAGDSDELSFQRNYFGFSAAYHLALDERRRNVLTLGAQYGSTSYSLSGGNDELVQQLTIDPALGGGGIGSPELRDLGGGDEQSFSSVNAGVMLRSVLDPKQNTLFEAGVNLRHLNSPRRETLLDTTSSEGMEDSLRRRPTLHAHARLDLAMRNDWRFQPSVLLMSSVGVTTVSLQGWMQRELKEDMDLRLGLGYRTGDAAQVLAGLDYKQLRAALSYNITLSQARSVTSYQNSFEIAAAYIFNIYKKPTVVPTMLCPRL
jgi:type IX secretion system PorP/SprF family membrane protein